MPSSSRSACSRGACARIDALRAQAHWLAGLALLQLATGLGNVLLGWPLAAAVLHTGGAAALAVVADLGAVRKPPRGRCQRAGASDRGRRADDNARATPDPKKATA